MYDADFFAYEVSFVLRNQLDSFIHEARVDPHLMNCNDLGHLAMKMVLSNMHTTFLLVYCLVELVLILPVATATMERAFSAMSIIKTDLRNRMGDDWLNHRMVCYIERDVFVSIEVSKIIERF
uniref:HAT C-terminal dimerisation domain-containing protein n=1 Tax=Triticum urartu TaxID=4572 RepID=A0A8R7JZE5_TRIUA